MPGKTSANVIFGQPVGIDRDHPDFWPLYLGSFILGGNFSARLMQTVRDRDGLTYGIGSSLAGIDDHLDGSFTVMATFAPSVIDRGVASTVEQLKLWATKGITAQELEDKKQTVTGTYKVRLATCDGLASTILTNSQRGKPLSYIDEFPKIINSITCEFVARNIFVRSCSESNAPILCPPVEDVRRAMQRIDVEKLTVVKAGSIATPAAVDGTAADGAKL